PTLALDAGIGVDDPAIDGDGGAHHVIAGPRGEVDRSPRHILIGPDPPRRHPLDTTSALSRAALFMSDLKGPGAIADTTMWSRISYTAIRRVRWISPDLLAA